MSTAAGAHVGGGRGIGGVLRRAARAATFPLVTVILAFLFGGLVVAIVGHPHVHGHPRGLLHFYDYARYDLPARLRLAFQVYHQLAVGAGLDWPFQYLSCHPPHHHGSGYLGSACIPVSINGDLSELYVTSTIVYATPLILAGLAVGFAFRCGLFNIGGQGQYWVGAYVAVEVATILSQRVDPGRTNSVFRTLHLVWLAHLFDLHIRGHAHLAMILATLSAALAGAAWASIAGLLKAFRGAHEVISTIMLNWIAIFGGQYLYGLGGPLQDKTSSAPQSVTVPPRATYDDIWGLVPGGNVTIGILIALGAAFVYWLVLSRSTLGYEVRAVGLNSEAARYGGISVRRSIVIAMLVAGLFAGLAGANDVLGSGSFQIQTTNLQVVDIGFTGIAVALLGRNSGIGIVFAGFLFAILHTGAQNITSGFDPILASNVATMIQGVIILFVGAELVVRWALRGRKVKSVADVPPPAAPPPAAMPAAGSPAA